MDLKNVKKLCSCGYTKDDAMVNAKTSYHKFGWLMLSIALSAKPKEVIFQCQQCGEIIERSSDPGLLNKFRYSSDVSK